MQAGSYIRICTLLGRQCLGAAWSAREARCANAECARRTMLNAHTLAPAAGGGSVPSVQWPLMPRTFRQQRMYSPYCEPKHRKQPRGCCHCPHSGAAIQKEAGLRGSVWAVHSLYIVPLHRLGRQAVCNLAQADRSPHSQKCLSRTVPVQRGMTCGMSTQTMPPTAGWQS